MLTPSEMALKLKKTLQKSYYFLGVGVKMAFLTSILDGFSQITHQNDAKKQGYNMYENIIKIVSFFGGRG